MRLIPCNPMKHFNVIFDIFFYESFFVLFFGGILYLLKDYLLYMYLCCFPLCLKLHMYIFRSQSHTREQNGLQVFANWRTLLLLSY